MKDEQNVDPHVANRARRGALLGVAGISALTVWHRPIIQSVLLPAHAQASAPPVDPQPPTNFFSSNAQQITTRTTPFSPLDLIAKPAYAQVGVDVLEVSIVANDPQAGTYDVTLQPAVLRQDLVQPAPNFLVQLTGTLTLDGGPGSLTRSASSCDSSFLEQAALSNLDTENKTITLQYQMVQYVVPDGSGSLSPLACSVQD